MGRAAGIEDTGATAITAVITTIPGREKLATRARLSVLDQRLVPSTIYTSYDNERRGAWWNRNQALEQVETPWVAWLDDDDEWLPNHLRVLAGGATRTGADLVFSYAEFVGGRDPLACCWRKKLVAEPINVPFGVEQRAHLDARNGEYCPHCGYLRGNFIPCCYLTRTATLRKAGGFPAPYSLGEITSGECEDYLMLLRMLDVGAEFYHVPGVRTWRYHMWGGNVGGRGADRMHELGET